MAGLVWLSWRDELSPEGMIVRKRIIVWRSDSRSKINEMVEVVQGGMPYETKPAAYTHLVI